jgi:hypothetical protein
MRWTHDGTISRALWIGGGQWAGKTTVGALLTGRHRLVHYHCDYHDARGHEDRRVAARARRGEPPIDWDAYWTGLSPEEMADRALADAAERFPWILDDLRALVSPNPVLVDGWSLRPDLVVEVIEDRRRMVVLVPTEEWRLRQAETLPRAVAAPAKQWERDRLLALDAAARAHALGIRVIEVDGTRDAASVADAVAGHFMI